MLTGPPPKFHGTRDILLRFVKHLLRFVGIHQRFLLTFRTRPLLTC